MRSFKILLIIGGILLLVSFGMVIGALSDIGSTSKSGDETFDIPAGPEWFVVIELDMQADGRVSMEFEETSEGGLVVHILDEANYAAYRDTGQPESTLLTTFGPSGRFFYGFEEEGRYYVVFEHGRGFEFQVQTVHIAYEFERLQPAGPDVVLLAVGAAIAGGGGLLIALGVSSSKKERAVTAPTEITDVIFFDER